MERLLVFLVLFFSGSVAFAQQVDNYKQDTTTLYQRAKGFSTDPIRSKWRQEVKKEGGLFILNLYDKKDVLQEKISFIDDHLLERKGVYMLFQNGNLKEEGNYEKGYKMGEWKSYYPNKQLLEKKNYVWDRLYGVSLTYWENGEIKESKNYVNDIKSGEWKLFYKSGKTASIEVYSEKGKLETGTYFDEQGKLVDLAYVTKAIK